MSNHRETLLTLLDLRSNGALRESLLGLLSELIEGAKKDLISIRLDYPEAEDSFLYEKLRLEGKQDLVRRIQESLALFPQP